MNINHIQGNVAYKFALIFFNLFILLLTLQAKTPSYYTCTFFTFTMKNRKEKGKIRKTAIQCNFSLHLLKVSMNKFKF